VVQLVQWRMKEGGVGPVVVVGEALSSLASVAGKANPALPCYDGFDLK